ncbi:MAG: site-specific DNA-methyltransferase [Candidatus Eisenbacteria bacterium]
MTRAVEDQDLLVRADGLEVARSLGDASLDLVYLDPPFGSGRAQLGPKGRGGRNSALGARRYEDPSHAGAPSAWLVDLLREMPRVLRPGGALFLHLDWRTVHRAKVLLDELIGADNFLNEIVWHYATGGIPERWFARKHDTLLYYRNGGDHTFHRQSVKKYLAHRMSRRGVPEYQDDGGWYRFRSLDDVWDIPWLTQDAKERTGYPTQKPEALLTRIVECASNEGDRVADFCVGSGTTAVVARRLRRRWIAVDRESSAVEAARARLAAQDEQGKDEARLRPFTFEDWLEPTLAPGKD